LYNTSTITSRNQQKTWHPLDTVRVPLQTRKKKATPTWNTTQRTTLK